MLAQAWRDRGNVEVRGQILRLVVAGPGSAARRYPVGNTGRARVPATTPASEMLTMLAASSAAATADREAVHETS